jgi:hypothetical protein
VTGTLDLGRDCYGIGYTYEASGYWFVELDRLFKAGLNGDIRIASDPVWRPFSPIDTAECYDLEDTAHGWVRGWVWLGEEAIDDIPAEFPWNARADREPEFADNPHIKLVALRIGGDHPHAVIGYRLA